LSLWDDFLDSGSKALGGVGRNLLKSIGVQPTATIPLAQGLVTRQAVQAGMSPNTAQKVTEQTFDNLVIGDQETAGSEVITTLDKYVYQPTYEAVGFAALMANPDTYSQEDEYSNAIARAWDGRKEISFGQAIADNYADYTNLLPDYGALAELNNVDINIYNDQMRERIYSRLYNEAGERVDSAGNKISEASWAENVFRNVSGGLDVGKQLVFDPLVAVGKVAKAGRLRYLDNFRSESIVKTNDWNVHQATHAEAGQRVAEEKLALINEGPELSRAKTVLEEIDNMRMFDDSIKAEVNYVRQLDGKELLDESLDVGVFVDDYRSYVKTLEDSVLTRQTKIDELNSLEAPKPTLATGVSEFVKQIVNRQMTWQEINAHRTIRDFGVDSEFLSVALAAAAKKGEGAVTDVLLIAQGSDPAAYFRLYNQQQSFVRLIDAAQTKMDDVEVIIQRAIDENDPLTQKRLNAQKAKLSEYVLDLRNEDTYLDKLLRTDNSLIGSLTGVPVSNAGKLSPIVESYRANKAITRAGLQDGTLKPLAVRRKPNKEFNWERIQRSPLHKPVYVAQWIGHRLNLEKPSGLVTVDGLDYYDGVKELRVFLDNTPVFDANVELKNSMMDAYVSAKDGTTRKRILEEVVEKEVIRATAEKYGIADTITKITNADGSVKEMPTWEFVWNKFKQERARAIADFKKDKVFAVDSNQTLISNPVLESQLDYAVPMIDADALDKYMADFSKDKGTWKTIAMNSRKAKEEWIMPTWATVDRFWRADVLVRLGYPQRNVLSEWMVLSQYDKGLSNMFSVGKMTEASKNFISNRYSYFQDVAARYQAGIDMSGSTAETASSVLRSLTPKQFVWGDYEKFATDTIKLLEEQKQGMMDTADELLGDPDFSGSGFVYPEAAIARIDTQINLEYQKLAEIAKRVAAKGERFGTQKSIAKTKVRIGPLEFAGVYEGPQGKATRALVSSGGRLNFDSSPIYSMLEEMGLARTGDFAGIHPTDDSYFASLATAVNQQFRGSRTAMRVIQGQSDKEILEYLNTPAGKEELRKLNWQEDIAEAQKEGGASRKAGKPASQKVVMGGEAVRVKVGETDLGQPIYEYYPSKDANVQNLIVDKYQSPEINYLDFVKSMVDDYLPNEAMKTLVRERLATDALGRGEGVVTTADLRIAARNAELKPIHGETFESSSIWQNPDTSLAEKANKWITDVMFRRIFRVIGEYPEDAYVSTPFAQAVYTNKLDEIWKTWEANGILEPSDLDMAQAQTIARKWAVKQSREYLYRVVRKNSIGDSIPVIAPFFQAQYSTFKRTGKLAYRNPDKSARLIYAWNQINTNATEDSKGNKFLMFKIPPGFYDENGFSNVMPLALRNALKSQNEWRWSVNSFNLLMAGLRMETPDVLPGQDEESIAKIARWAKAGQSIIGVGPTVQIAANEIIKNNPALDAEATEVFGIPIPKRDIMEIFASPYPSDKWYAPFQSAWNRRLSTLMTGDVRSEINGPSNNDFERTQLVMFQNHLDRIRTGEEQPLSNDVLKNNEMLWEMSGEEASSFTALRLAVNLSFGFIPSYEGPMSGYIELYRGYQTKYGVTAYDKWLEDYPDMGYIAISRSKNLAGSSASTDAVALRMEHGEMIERALAETGLSREDSLPFIQMITNKNVGAPVLRDPYASYWQKKTGDRVTLTAEEGYANQQVRDGWAKFFIENENYEAELKSRKISRYANAAEGLNEIKRKRLEDIGKQNPEWWQEYTALSGPASSVGFVRAMKVALNDEKFRNSLPEDSYWFDIEGIINERDLLVEAARDTGKATPTKEMKEVYGERIMPYLQNETAKYYFYKFLESDTFAVDQPK
jgi:hypothetical protein